MHRNPPKCSHTSLTFIPRFKTTISSGTFSWSLDSLRITCGDCNRMFDTQNTSHNNDPDYGLSVRDICEYLDRFETTLQESERSKGTASEDSSQFLVWSHGIKSITGAID